MKSGNEMAISGIAESVFEDVSNTFSNQKEFVIVGHSFGSLVALRLASMLEKVGKVGRLVLIDGSPEYLWRLAQGVSQGVEGGIENDLFMMIFKLFCYPESIEDFVKKLSVLTDIKMKIDCLSEFTLPEYKDKYSKDYIYNVAVAISNRLKLIAGLNIGNDDMAGILDTKLKSPITLIRPSEASFADIDEDYYLNKYSEQKVNIKYVNGHHLTVLENIELTNILNELISQQTSES